MQRLIIPKSSLLLVILLTAFALLAGLSGRVGYRSTSAASPPSMMFNPDTIYAVTTSNLLIRFDSATPGTVTTIAAITGLQTGEQILGIDFRPATGQLYGLGSTSRLYTINTTTAAATQVGTGTFTPALSGTDFGFDFNPTVDLIRVVSDADQNFRLNPTTGAGVATDTALAYAAGDPNAGQNPVVVGAAYTNNLNGATTTSLFDIDASLDILARQGGVNVPPGTPSPNTGQLFTVGALGVNTNGLVGFDISAAGTAFASLTPDSTSSLYTVNLSSGAATLVGTIGGGLAIRDIAVFLPCELTCPLPITVSNTLDQCGAIVNYPAPTATGACGTITCDPPSGYFFPVGTTTVNCSSTTAPKAANRLNAGCSTLTQSTSQTITPLNSVSCNDGIGHTANSYWRAFSLPAFGITGNFNVQSVDIGVEEATAGGAARQTGTQATGFARRSSLQRPLSVAATQPISVRLYTSSQPFPTGFPGSLTLIGSVDTTIADQSSTIVTIPVTGVAPAGSQLVVEVHTPDGQLAGNLFFIGSNSAPETGPSYLSAPDCGVTTPTTTAALGFPDMHIVMNVNGCEAGCSFTVTVNDTQPPSIQCPTAVTAVAALTCPPTASMTTVNYPPPTVSDNCPLPPGAVVCNPPSGSMFPVGTTTITCTVTDASSNTNSCMFTITVFNACIQDDTNPANVILFNTFTGAYRACCGGMVFTGVGTVYQQGCDVTLQHNAATYRVTAKWSSMYLRGSGSVQSPPGTTKCTITDRDIRNNTCQCAAPVMNGQ